MSNNLLFELGTEELPSASVWPLADALANNLITGLAQAELKHGKVSRYATPRRLAVFIQDVETLQQTQKISRKGPAYQNSLNEKGEPSAALQGFAKSCGVSVAELTRLQTDKGEWWAYETLKEGAHTADLLPDMIRQAVAALPIAKLMRWGAGDAEFARPVHWAVLLFGNKAITTGLLGITTGAQSFGHRFHHPQAITISSPDLYEALLQDAYVIADFAKRRNMIKHQVENLAQSIGAQPVMPDALLDEVTSIVEWPRALLANFAEEFLEVPPEVLIASMQSHQKCFALRDLQGKLLPHFITISNIESQQPAQVILGNEKVMRARLSDAAFFYRQDKKQALHTYQERTAHVIFQARLGSLQDKAQRIQRLMDYLVHPLQLKHTQALRAAELSKCDLMSGMVGEFPELQGLMGYYYAHHDGEDEAVAQAINEQYMPRFAGDILPASTLGLALSLADRIDTLVGIFAIGQKPTGMKDPFKLRRHALAVVRLLVATPAALNLSTLLEEAANGYEESVKAHDILAELRLFILERMQSFYQGQGIPAELVQAVRAEQDDWLYDADKRIKALLDFILLPEAASLSAACKRVNNILQQSSPNAEITLDPNLFTESAEQNLFNSLQKMENLVFSLYTEGDYKAILNQLASLREPVDAFFDQVMVMVDNEAIKKNRLALLGRLRLLLQGVADISLLPQA
ncbi:glycine--tRNA ligase subunit beta [Legionella septentrionalis]|uniref:glycine--tRNA ligase subunit beta n=1 Tax=Legionella septentrionalis TaxID=2498109 RepID=UPI000F8C8E0D|nr:glycine--tRNA ligase subunit beta [Legionella septentrionalis]RUR11737.1 glycine--tRNA ligase subunit beta [Legionella septentrionalis]